MVSEIARLSCRRSWRNNTKNNGYNILPIIWQIVRHSWRLANDNWFWPQSLMRHQSLPTLPKAGWLVTVYCRDVLSRVEEVKAYITSTFGSVLKINSTKKVKYYKQVNFISIVIIISQTSFLWSLWGLHMHLITAKVCGFIIEFYSQFLLSFDSNPPISVLRPLY